MKMPAMMPWIPPLIGLIWLATRPFEARKFTHISPGTLYPYRWLERFMIQKPMTTGVMPVWLAVVYWLWIAPRYEFHCRWARRKPPIP